MSRVPNIDHRGAGGKMVRGRRPAPSSPYLRPDEGEEASQPPSSSQVDSKGWFSGIISSAGRIISSVFSSDSATSSDCSSSSDSDLEACDETDEKQFRDASTRDISMLDQAGAKLELVESQAGGRELVASTSETKLAIEKLLQQETYSRDESKRLMEIIQSRVVESTSMMNDRNRTDVNFSKRATCSDLASPCFLGSSQNYLLGRSPRSPTYLSTFYPKFLADQVYSPYSTNTAMMEAKKWVEEQRLTSSLKTGLSCEPCTLNTDPFHHDGEGEGGSPVDMAKSYMQALPPWRSPVSSSIGFRTPSSAASLERYESPYMTTGHFLPSLEALKRQYLEDETWDTSRKVHQIIESISPAAKDSPDATENVRDGCPHGIVSPPDTNASKDSCFTANRIPAVTVNAFGNNDVPASEETSSVEHGRLNSSTADVPLTSETEVQDESYTSKHQVTGLEEQWAGPVTIHNTFVTDIPFPEHNGGLVEDVLNAEPIAVLPVTTTCAPSSLQTYPDTENLGRDDDSQGNHSLSDMRETVDDTRLHDRHVWLQKKPIKNPARTASNGVPYSHSGSLTRAEAVEKSTGSFNADNNDSHIRNGNRDCETSKGVLGGHGRNTEVDQQQLGITINTIKQMLKELPPGSTRGRGRKAVVRGRRGRGRGK